MKIKYKENEFVFYGSTLDETIKSIEESLETNIVKSDLKIVFETKDEIDEYITSNIYSFYPIEKQTQDEKWVSSYTTKLKAQGVENLELKVVQMITSFYQGSNLEEILLNIEDTQKPYFKKLVKIGIRTEWMENCIKEGIAAIDENREAVFPIFPKIH